MRQGGRIVFASPARGATAGLNPDSFGGELAGVDG